MRKTILGMAAAALMFAGCSKEELVDETMPSEGVSSIASAPGQEKAIFNPNAPRIWFNNNQGRMVLRLGGPIGNLPKDCRPKGSISFRAAEGSDDVQTMEASLCRIGNSRFYRSARNTFEFSEEDFFSLVDFKVDWNDEDDTPQEVSGSLFLYPSGRTVAQNPRLARLRVGPQLQTGSGANGKNWRMIIADDPTQTVSSVSVKAAAMVDEDGQVIDGEDLPAFELEQTHFNQNLGLTRFVGRQLNAEVSRNYEVSLNGSGTYGVDFLDEETNAVILSKYTIADVSDETVGVVVADEVDEPEFLGTALRSKTGESWAYEVAIADLGDWVESASATITYSDPKGFNTSEAQFDLQLVRTEGNLKVFRAEGLFLEGLEPGTEVQALVSSNGKGTKKASTQIVSTASISLL
ncbi:MAG: hypothetical protein ACPGU4_06780 [Flavobacteriales bacterium]